MPRSTKESGGEERTRHVDKGVRKGKVPCNIERTTIGKESNLVGLESEANRAPLCRLRRRGRLCHTTTTGRTHGE